MRIKKPSSGEFHDRAIRTLESKLKSKHHTLFKEFEYKYRGMHEADLLVISNDKKYAYAYEVKTTNHYRGRKKAYKQLNADEVFLRKRFKIKNVFKFYVHKAKGKEIKNGREYKINYVE